MKQQTGKGLNTRGRSEGLLATRRRSGRRWGAVGQHAALQRAQHVHTGDGAYLLVGGDHLAAQRGRLVAIAAAATTAATSTAAAVTGMTLCCRFPLIAQFYNEDKILNVTLVAPEDKINNSSHCCC